MTVFGDRDFTAVEHTPAPRAEPGWAPAAKPSLPPMATVTTLPHTLDTRRVIVRVTNGEEIEVGRTEGREPAVRLARETIKLIEDAASDDAWPEVGDRFLRPGAIVSIDVQRADGVA
ncbi:MAG: hypothetical protein U0R50_14100 [Gaiellales bacterium]